MVRNLLAPGLRFRPTEVELVWYYLKRKIMGKPIPHEAIADVKLYELSPWDLPALSCLPSRDLEWYFFCPRERRYSHGNRTNRATKTGFWKATGRDRPILNNYEIVGMIKSLVYFTGKPPKCNSTDWIMYEYRLESEEMAKEGYTQDAYVICKLFKKNGKQSGAPFIEEEWEGVDNFDYSSFFASSAPPQNTTTKFCGSSFEAGKRSSKRESTHVQIVSEASTLQPDGIGKLSTQNHSEIEVENSRAGEQHEQPELGNPFAAHHSCADSMFMDQVENYLSSSSPFLNMEEPGIQLDDITQLPLSDNENVYDNLEEICPLPVPVQCDGLVPWDILGYNPMAHNEPSVLSFCEEDMCMFIDDIPINSYSFSIYGDGNAADETEPSGPSAATDPLPSSSECMLLQNGVP